MSSMADDERLDLAQDALELAAHRIGQELGLAPIDICTAMSWALANTAARHTPPDAREAMLEDIAGIVRGAMENAYREIDRCAAAGPALADIEPQGSA